MKSATRGFTLIEILLVVAIIALLAAVLAPSLTSARIRARDAKRVSDLHSVTIALALYANDHHGSFPSGTGSLAALVGELVPGYVSQVPTDPVYGNTADGYQYCQANGGTSYQIVTRLEGAEGSGWCTIPGTPLVTGSSCWTTGGVPNYPVCDPTPSNEGGNGGGGGEGIPIEELPPDDEGGGGKGGGGGYIDPPRYPEP